MKFMCRYAKSTKIWNKIRIVEILFKSLFINSKQYDLNTRVIFWFLLKIMNIHHLFLKICSFLSFPSVLSLWIIYESEYFICSRIVNQMATIWRKRKKKQQTTLTPNATQQQQQDNNPGSNFPPNDRSIRALVALFLVFYYLWRCMLWNSNFQYQQPTLFNCFPLIYFLVCFSLAFFYDLLFFFEDWNQWRIWIT